MYSHAHETQSFESAPSDLSVIGNELVANYGGKTYKVVLPLNINVPQFRQQLTYAVNEAGSNHALIATYYSDREGHKKEYHLDPNPQTNPHAKENIITGHAAWLKDLIEGIIKINITEHADD